MDEFDVIVLGMGPGGGDAAPVGLVEAGLSVAAVEAGLVGGECPYWGCVPSKMMIQAAHVLGGAWRVSGLAGSATVSPTGPRSPAGVREEGGPRLGRPGRRRPLQRRRAVISYAATEPSPAARGGRGRPGAVRPARCADLHRVHPGHPGHRRPVRNALLDQSRRDQDRVRARLDDRPRRRRRSSWSWPRSSPASAPRSPWRRPPPRLLSGEPEPGHGELIREGSSATKSTPGAADYVVGRRVDHQWRPVRRDGRGQGRRGGAGCWSWPVGRPIWRALLPSIKDRRGPRSSRR